MEWLQSRGNKPLMLMPLLLPLASFTSRDSYFQRGCGENKFSSTKAEFAAQVKVNTLCEI